MAAGAVAALKLPLMSVSDENIKTREKYDALNNRLNRLVAGSTVGSAASLLKEGEQSSEEKETMKETEKAQETMKEIASAKALNDVLFRQNMKLAQQNTKLEEGLTYVRSLPAK